MKKRQKQIDIVVRYLCSKQANKNGRLTITDKDTQFLAKHGCDLGSCLQEFKNREYIKYHAPAIFIPNPTVFEIELLPSCYQHFNETISHKKIAVVISTIAAITAITLSVINNLNGIVELISKLTPQEKYETSTQWINNQDALSLVTEKSKITFTTTNSYSDRFYDGASLFALFTNTTDVARQIESVTISAMNIVEDLSPDLFVFSTQRENKAMLNVKNRGWSDTGEMVITIENISPPRLTSWGDGQSEEENANSIASVIPLTPLLYSETFSVEPGVQLTIPLMVSNAFDIIWYDTSVENFYFDVTCRLQSLDIDYSRDCTLRMCASHDGVELIEDAFGGYDEPQNHVIVIDTSQESWTKTYPVYQPLPAKQTIRLPIFIFPTKTCTMSLKVTFQMSDGETLEAQWLDNQRFTIFYYEELSDNLINLFENWNDISNETIIYMPE